MIGNVARPAKAALPAVHPEAQGTEAGMNRQQQKAIAAARPGRSWPLVAELFCDDASREWDWEGIRVGGKLYLYCYLRGTVVALAPFDFEI